MGKIGVFGLVVLAVVTIGCGGVETDGLPERYSWRQVQIGGGGYVTGIKIHPANNRLIYLRTDVGGCYRYDEESDRLVQLMDWVSYEDRNYYGINGIAVDPRDEDVVYIAAGKYPDQKPADVFRSGDQGKTWTPLHLNKTWGANFHPFRTGNLLEVNPHTGELWAGTLGDGLWKYADGKWMKVESVPDGRFARGGETENVAEGPLAICFDPADPEYVYVAVRGYGVYRSTDGGQTFAGAGRLPADIYDLSLSADGTTLFAALNDKGAFWLSGCRTSNDWKDVSFVTNDIRVRTVTCSPHDKNTVISANGRYDCLNEIFISKDNGDSWRRLPGKARSIVPWHPAGYPGSAISQFAFDPSDTARVYFTDWYSFYKTDDITADTVMWDNRMAAGHEEMVPVTMAANELPNRQQVSLYVGGADLSAVQITDPDRFSELPNIGSLSGSRLFQEISGIDCFGKDPDVVAFCGGEGWDMKRGGLCITRDGGMTLRICGGYDPSWGGGRVVFSASDARNLVVVTRKGVKYTLDGGVTFASSVGTSGHYGQGGIFGYIPPLCADRVNDNFYLYDQETGDFSVSADRGKSFRAVSVLPRASGEKKITILAVLGKPGHVWAALGSKGLYYSRDGGHRWEKAVRFTDASLIAAGKEASGSHDAALYVWGKMPENNRYRFYRSVDGGACWEPVNRDPKAGNETQVLCADKNVFGRFYVGTNGSGVFCAEEKQ